MSKKEISMGTLEISPLWHNFIMTNDFHGKEIPAHEQIAYS